jgi:hypothetical protein
MIRARCKQDIERIAKELDKIAREEFNTEAEHKIIRVDHADYRYRVKTKKMFWGDYLYQTVLNLDYSTVKDNICPEPKKSAVGMARKKAYYSIWASLHEFQNYCEMRGHK